MQLGFWKLSRNLRVQVGVVGEGAPGSPQRPNLHGA